MTECLLPNDEPFTSDNSVPDWKGKSIRRDVALSDYRRSPVAFQLRRLRFATLVRADSSVRCDYRRRGTGNCSPGLSRFQTESAIQRGRDVNHVYALEELVPGWGSTKRHSPSRVFPDRNHYARNVRGHRTALERLLDASLLRGRSLSERPIHRNDDYVVTIASQMRHLKCGHCVFSLRGGISHLYGDFNRRASASMSVFYLELSVFYHPREPPPSERG
jgi:hypothetical protein